MTARRQELLAVFAQVININSCSTRLANIIANCKRGPAGALAGMGPALEVNVYCGRRVSSILMVSMMPRTSLRVPVFRAGACRHQ